MNPETEEREEESRKLVDWVKGMVTVMGWGGKQQAAERLGMTPTAFSKLINVPNRAFDQKTMAVVAWILQSKAELHGDKAVIESLEIDGVIFEVRAGGIVTWRRE
jgi:hypothetical protein